MKKPRWIPTTMRRDSSQRENDRDKEEVERRLAYLEAQVRILNQRARLEDERRVRR